MAIAQAKSITMNNFSLAHISVLYLLIMVYFVVYFGWARNLKSAENWRDDDDAITSHCNFGPLSPKSKTLLCCIQCWNVGVIWDSQFAVRTSHAVYGALSQGREIVGVVLPMLPGKLAKRVTRSWYLWTETVQALFHKPKFGKSSSCTVSFTGHRHAELNSSEDVDMISSDATSMQLFKLLSATKYM